MTAPTWPEALVERESKEATHRRYYDAFHAWFMKSGCDFWSECDAPEYLAQIAVEMRDADVRAALEASGLREAQQKILNARAGRDAYKKLGEELIAERDEARAERDALQLRQRELVEEIATLNREKDVLDGWVRETHDSKQELVEALTGLLQVIETDALIPESVSYMRQARAALARARKED